MSKFLWSKFRKYTTPLVLGKRKNIANKHYRFQLAKLERQNSSSILSKKQYNGMDVKYILTHIGMKNGKNPGKVIRINGRNHFLK